MTNDIFVALTDGLAQLQRPESIHLDLQRVGQAIPTRRRYYSAPIKMTGRTLTALAVAFKLTPRLCRSRLLLPKAAASVPKVLEFCSTPPGAKISYVDGVISASMQGIFLSASFVWRSIVGDTRVKWAQTSGVARCSSLCHVRSVCRLRRFES